jgi:pimeloyl-ACP methyl ester carboxylesterase
MSPGTAAQPWDLPETFFFEGQQVRYGILGSGEPLVLLHGTPFSSVVWRRIAPHLAGRRRVFYFDLLGYGRSEMRPGQPGFHPISTRPSCLRISEAQLFTRSQNRTCNAMSSPGSGNPDNRPFTGK